MYLISRKINGLVLILKQCDELPEIISKENEETNAVS